MFATLSVHEVKVTAIGGYRCRGIKRDTARGPLSELILLVAGNRGSAVLLAGRPREPLKRFR